MMLKMHSVLIRERLRRTTSRVCFAFSLTSPRAMMGMLSEAFLRVLFGFSRNGTDMFANGGFC